MEWWEVPCPVMEEHAGLSLQFIDGKPMLQWEEGWKNGDLRSE
jgi:hypothetical protein